jgi:hypothetical protein
MISSMYGLAKSNFETTKFTQYRVGHKSVQS